MTRFPLVPAIATKFGAPLDSPALRASGITITMHDRNTSKSSAGGGLFQSGPMYGDDPRLADLHIPKPEMEAGDVALSISDPHERFLNVEFRDSDGHSLRYNHNGYSHSSSQGARVDLYRLGDRIPPGTAMVVWLKTPKSLLVVPVKATDLPLPEEAASGR